MAGRTMSDAVRLSIFPRRRAWCYYPCRRQWCTLSWRSPPQIQLSLITSTQSPTFLFLGKVIEKVFENLLLKILKKMDNLDHFWFRVRSSQGTETVLATLVEKLHVDQDEEGHYSFSSPSWWCSALLARVFSLTTCNGCELRALSFSVSASTWIGSSS